MDPLAIVVLLVTGALVATIALCAKHGPRMGDAVAPPMKTSSLSTTSSVAMTGRVTGGGFADTGLALDRQT